MKKLFSHLILIVAMILTATTNLLAQVTIGSGIAPNVGSLLDLKQNNNINANSVKGMGLPRVELKDINNKTDLAETMGLASGTLAADAHIGLVVYNMGKDETSAAARFCPGVHVWDGTAWQPLVAYPALQERIVPSTVRGFEYLDPDNPTGWPSEKESDRAANKYALGNNGTVNGTADITDLEGNTYHVSRFYVGYKLKIEMETTQTSYDCSTSPTNWVDVSSVEISRERTSFEDGLWMTQNLRTKTLPDGGLINSGSADGSNSTSPRFHYPSKDDTSKPFATILYNWAAASNSRKITTQEGGGILPAGGEAKIRGICPEGWRLPNDQEWTDLENGIILKTKTFSSSQDIGVNKQIKYDDIDSRGQHSTAMRNTTDSGSPQGTSKPAGNGGFDSYPAGRISANTVDRFGVVGYYWSSSSYNGNDAWYRSLNNTAVSVNRKNGSRYNLFSVRCKKAN